MTGLTSTKDTIAKTITISGTPTDSCTYNITTVQPLGTAVSLSGTITIEEPSDVVTVKSETGAQLFPNPAGHSFHVKGFEGSATVMVMDLSGKLLVAKDVISNEIIAVDELTQGMYIVKIVHAKGIVEMKLLKE